MNFLTRNEEFSRKFFGVFSFKMIVKQFLRPGSCTADFRFESVLETESVLGKKNFSSKLVREIFFPKHFQTESQLYMIRA